MKSIVPVLSIILFAASAPMGRAGVHYVDLNSTGAISPYAEWATAATTIQDALDAANAGDEIVVTNGTYETGARMAVGVSSNRLVVASPVILRSVNGPAVTVIKGYQMVGTTNGNEAIRCAYLTNGAVLAGFTLMNGATRGDGYSQDEQSGGGVWCDSGTVVISNCVIAGNSASLRGGGVYRGLLTNCTVINNTAVGGLLCSGGGVYGSTLTGCLVSGNVSAASGGGVSSATVFSSLLENNSGSDGGGAHNSVLYGCALTANSASHNGGGAHNGSLKNCTISGNSAANLGGGIYYGAPTNCIIYHNVAKGASPDFLGSGSPYYCCISGWSGSGNITADPLLASSSHISADSPCRGTGFTNSTGFDIDGESWAKVPSIGSDEPYPAAATGPLTLAITMAYTNVAPGFALALTAKISGNLSASRWEFGDGTVLSNSPYASHAWSAAGDYQLVLRAYNAGNPEGITATTVIHVVDQVHYVAADNPTPAPPYTSWATAATSIQEAVDAAVVPGATVLVTNGVYATGGTIGPSPNLTTNRVAVQKPLILRSVNGPAYTTIQGYQVPGVTNGDQAIRCVYLTHAAGLVGFTLTNGATLAGQWNGYQCGGGAYCESGAFVSNCVLIGNSTAGYGGGVNGGTLSDCAIIGNSAIHGGGSENATLFNCFVSSNNAYFGGGADYGTLKSCLLINNVGINSGGGAANSTLYNCIVTNNYGEQGGGAFSAVLFNCTLANNSGYDGGGSYGGTLNNCTLTGNFAQRYGHGAFSSTLNNCIVYYNSDETNHYNSTLKHCCTLPLPSGGPGNFTNAPLFIDLEGGDTHLRADSLCINSGNNSFVSTATDLGGDPRIAGGLVDVGAFEFQNPASVMPYAWLYQYGLAVDPSVHAADPDGDGMNNWQEWVAGTNPTNAASVLALVSLTKKPSGIMVSWRSAAGVRYFVQRSSNFAAQSPFSVLATNIYGLSGTTTYTDRSATNGGPYFYRVGVFQ